MTREIIYLVESPHPFKRGKRYFVAYYNAEGTSPVGSSGDTVEEATARLKSFHPDAEIRVIPQR